MTPPAEVSPSEGLRARALHVERRAGRLVVWSGLPGWVVLLAVGAMPVVAVLAVGGRGRWGARAAAGLLLAAAYALVAWTVNGSWTVRLDRGAGWAWLRRGPWRTRRPLTDFVGVRCCSASQAQIERARRLRQVMPYAVAGDAAFGVALVDRAGRWWRVTRSQDRAYGRPTPRREDIEVAARLVAAHLGLPLLPPIDAPSGAVPPPLVEEAG